MQETLFANRLELYLVPFVNGMGFYAILLLIVSHMMNLCLRDV